MRDLNLTFKSKREKVEHGFDHFAVWTTLDFVHLERDQISLEL
jgi:hypothetical protein